MKKSKASSFTVVYFLALSVVVTEAKDSLTNSIDHSPKTKPTKLSEFFIGDLLRTTREEPLESASTNENPLYVTERMEVVTDQTSYKSHGGHDYSEEEGGHAPSSKSSTESSRITIPIEELEKQAEMKPSASRTYVQSRDSPHHHKPCHKKQTYSSDEDYSTEEVGPPPSIRTYSSQAAPSTYHSEDEPYSEGSGSSYPTRTKSYSVPQNTRTRSKSQSTTSKSVSVSKTVNPSNRGRRVRLYPHTEPSVKQQLPNNAGVVVYKVREEPKQQEEEDYYDEDHDSQQKERGVTQFYDRYPSKHRHSNPPVQKSRHEYDSRRPQYDSDTYEPTRSPPVKHVYISQTPPTHYSSKSEEEAYSSETQAPVSDGRVYHHTSSPSKNRHQVQSPSYRPQPYPPSSKQARPDVKYGRQSTEPSVGQIDAPYEGKRYLKPSEATRQVHTYNPNNYRNEDTEEKAETRAPYQPVIQGRNHGHGLKQLPSKVSGSKVSKSVSYSESSYGIPQPTRNPARQHPAHVYDAPQKITNTLQHQVKTQARNPGYQTTYKPYNSEYPASYTSNAPRYGPQGGEGHVSPSSYDNTAQTHDEQFRPYQGPILPQALTQHYQEPQTIYGSPQRPYEEPPQRPYSEPPLSYEEPSRPYEQPPRGYDEPQRPYEEPHQPYEAPYETNAKPQQSYDSEEEDFNNNKHHKGYTKTKTNISGYKDHYESSVPLELDDAFFEKYGISKTAKIIVATAMQPNLFVADGTNIKEPASDDEPVNHPSQDRPVNYNSNHGPVDHHSNDGPTDEERKLYNDEEHYQQKPEGFSLAKNLPGSFIELVDTNTEFLRHLEEVNDENNASLDELLFRSNVGDPKAIVNSQGNREIYQKHGNGFSRIIFNQPLDFSKLGASKREGTSNKSEGGMERNGQTSEKIEKSVKSPRD